MSMARKKIEVGALALMLVLDAADQGPITTIAFVGGPLHGRTEPGDGSAVVIPVPPGHYRRSARCTDDGALRYVWQAAPVATETDRPEGSQRTEP
jgi:hypothetical protein